MLMQPRRTAAGTVGSCPVHNPHYDFNDEALPLGASREKIATTFDCLKKLSTLHKWRALEAAGVIFIDPCDVLATSSKSWHRTRFRNRKGLALSGQTIFTGFFLGAGTRR
jgi:hypothetical protein